MGSDARWHTGINTVVHSIEDAVHRLQEGAINNLSKKYIIYIFKCVEGWCMGASSVDEDQGGVLLESD